MSDTDEEEKIIEDVLEPESETATPIATVSWSDVLDVMCM